MSPKYKRVLAKDLKRADQSGDDMVIDVTVDPTKPTRVIIQWSSGRVSNWHQHELVEILDDSPEPERDWLADWKYEVANGDTIQGFQKWLLNQDDEIDQGIEEDADGNLNGGVRITLHYRDHPEIDGEYVGRLDGDGCLYVTGEHFGILLSPEQRDAPHFPVWYEVLPSTPPNPGQEGGF